MPATSTKGGTKTAPTSQASGATPTPTSGGGGGGGGGGTGGSTTTATPVPNVCNIVAPIMGGVELKCPKDNIWIAWVGGKPLSDWSALDITRAVSVPKSTQFRQQNIKDVKGEIFRIKGLEVKFKQESDLRAFCLSVWKHFVQNGMDTITYFPDPADNTKMVSIVENPNRFTKEYIVSKLPMYEALYDNYDRLNIGSAMTFGPVTAPPRQVGVVVVPVLPKEKEVAPVGPLSHRLLVVLGQKLLLQLAHRK